MKQPLAVTQTEIVYESSDLELFAEATNWKSYWSSTLRPYIHGSVIEVGAGLGTSTDFLCRPEHPFWLCMDPDPTHAARIARRIAVGELPACCKAQCGILSDVPKDQLVDTILYIDVLEHIEKDEDEMRTAAKCLKPGGRIIILSPAFNWLYSPFDKAVGHYRRYEKPDAKRLTVDQLALREVYFLDSLGLLLSLANRLFLKSSMPTSRQIAFWDRIVVPLSIYTDRIFGRWFGRSIVMVWQKV